eukprot:COSAG06_NODE_5070_length_3748_cov_22.062757_5_plen_49_part_01
MYANASDRNDREEPALPATFAPDQGRGIFYIERGRQLSLLADSMSRRMS